MFRIDNMPDCCWKYLKGTNQCKQDFELLKRVLMQTFNAGEEKEYKNPPHFPGAILFAGAYGGDTIPAHMMGGPGVTGKTIIKKNIKGLCNFFEEEEVGSIVEMPEYRNELHNSTIIPVMVCIKEKEFKAALTRWALEMGKTWQLKTKDSW